MWYCLCRRWLQKCSNKLCSGHNRHEAVTSSLWDHKTSYLPATSKSGFSKGPHSKPLTIWALVHARSQALLCASIKHRTGLGPHHSDWLWLTVAGAASQPMRRQRPGRADEHCWIGLVVLGGLHAEGFLPSYIKGKKPLVFTKHVQMGVKNTNIKCACGETQNYQILPQ